MGVAGAGCAMGVAGAGCAVGAAGAGAAGPAGAAGRGAGGPGRADGAGVEAPLPPPGVSASRSRRATGASTVEEADFTNSPCSLSLASTVLLSTPNSLASSCTRALPGTDLLIGEAGGLARSTPRSVVHGHRWDFTAGSSDDVLLSMCGPAWCRPDWNCGLSFVVSRPSRSRGRERLRGGTEDVGPERTGLQRATAAQCPDEGPASLRRVQALRGGVQGCPPAGEPTPRIRDEGPARGDDTQQLGDRSALPAAHTGAHRDRRRFGPPRS